MAKGRLHDYVELKCKIQIAKCKMQKLLKSNPLLGGARGGFLWVKDKRQKEKDKSGRKEKEKVKMQNAKVCTVEG